MNLLLLVVLAVVTWVLLEANMTFFAFLTILVLVLFAAGSFTKKPAASHGHAIHGTSHGHGRAMGERTHRYTIKDPWINQKTMEDLFQGAGKVFFWPLKQVVSYIRYSDK